MLKNRFYILSSLLLSTLLLFSCSSWLEVDPKDQISERDLYKTERSINTLMNGFYKSLSSQTLYGMNLATTITDVLGQYYTIFPGYGEEGYLKINNQLVKYNYTDPQVESYLSSIWRRTYALVFEINVFINKIKDNDVVSEAHRELLLGEAHALRAYLHFDLYRLFGPVHSLYASSTSIPYNKAHEVESPVNLTGEKFMEECIKDINLALTHLEEDPIRVQGIMDFEKLIGEVDSFYKYRNRRLNFYATKALKARALQYIGDQEQAAVIAEEVLSETIKQDKVFQWTPFTGKTTTEGDVAVIPMDLGNYMAYNDVLFGFHSSDMYTIWRAINDNTRVTNLYGVNKGHLERVIFNLNEGETLKTTEDFRARQWQSSIADSEVYVSKKFRDGMVNTEHPITYFQPLMRISELYYIVAENSMNKGDVTKAVDNINEVLKARGWINIMLLKPESTTLASFTSELKREYYKEFFGEGQVFYFHKRRNEATIFNASNTGQLITMTPEMYKADIPLVETEQK